MINPSLPLDVREKIPMDSSPSPEGTEEFRTLRHFLYFLDNEHYVDKMVWSIQVEKDVKKGLMDMKNRHWINAYARYIQFSGGFDPEPYPIVNKHNPGIADGVHRIAYLLARGLPCPVVFGGANP